MRQRHHRRARGGFSLIEAVVATTIIGLGVVAVMSSALSGTRVNDEGTKLTDAVMLAREVREHLLGQSFESIQDVTYTSCIDGMGYPLDVSSAWQQRVTVDWRQNNNIAQNDLTQTSDVKYVQVEILHNDETLLTTGWLVTRREDG